MQLAALEAECAGLFTHSGQRWVFRPLAILLSLAATDKPAGGRKCA
jgi:hypothetical protein